MDLWSTCGRMKLGRILVVEPTIYAGPRESRGLKRGLGGHPARGIGGLEGSRYPAADYRKIARPDFGCGLLVHFPLAHNSALL